MEVTAGAGQQVEAERRDDRGHPRGARDALAQGERADHRRQHHEQAGDEAGVRRRRVLEAERLADVADRQEHAHREAGAQTLARKHAQLPAHDRDDDRGGCREAVGEERHRRQHRDRVLDHGERQPPDGGDADERELGPGFATNPQVL